MLKKLLLVTAFLWTVAVAVLCLINMKAFGAANNLNWPYKDKYLHFAFHFGITLLWVLYLSKRNGTQTFKMRLSVFMFTTLYGILLEIFQGFFTTGRQADIYDAVANTSGSAIAILLLWLVSRNNKTELESSF